MLRKRSYIQAMLENTQERAEWPFEINPSSLLVTIIAQEYK